VQWPRLALAKARQFPEKHALRRSDGGLLNLLGSKESMFFFEKKNQKTFVRCRGPMTKTRLKNKSFLLLFFKKEDLSF
jgi:hypothetical protein